MGEKRKKMTVIFVFACFFFANFANCQYTPPKAKVEPLSPRGIRISIPNEPGISLVAFHVKFNEDFQGLEAGTIARDIVRSRNDRWTYEDRTTRLRNGDVIYYWIHVVYDGLGYNLLDQQHQVDEFFSVNDAAKVNQATKNDQNSEKPSCAPTETRLIHPITGQRRNICSGELLLNEQFDNLNNTIWQQIEKFTGSPDYGFVVYRNDQRNVKFTNGNLQITPNLLQSEFDQDFIRNGNLTLERCTGEHGTIDCQREALGAYILPPVSSGLIDTKNSFAFIYGKIEIRAKLPRGDWIYPILSLERLDKLSTSSSSSQPQLRIAFTTGNSILRGPNGNDLSGHVLRGGQIDTNTGNCRSSSLPKRHSSDMWSDDYHIYELEWRRDKVLSRVDGLEYGSTETRTPFVDRSFYLNLGVAVGGHEEFPDSSMSDGYPKPWRNVGSKALYDFFNATELWSRTWNDDFTSLKIDYVKVWAL